MSFTTSKIPIYIGAQGPKMLGLAGDVAPTVFMINASIPMISSSLCP